MITPESGKIYINIAVTPATQYRWSGSVYVQVGGGGKRTMYLFFPIYQNIAASTSWYYLPTAGQIFAGNGYVANASLTDANDFADMSFVTPRLFVPFKHKVKSVSIHGSVNTAKRLYFVSNAGHPELTNSATVAVLAT